MLCVALLNKPEITVSLYAQLCVRFALLEEENPRIQCLIMIGIVTESAGRCVFIAWTRLGFFSSEMVLQHFNDSKVYRGQIICHTHSLSLSFCHSHAHTDLHTRVHAYTHTCTNVHIQTEKNVPHSLSLCLCLREQLNLSLRFYSGLKSREMVCGV